jgi:hypothetical protein
LRLCGGSWKWLSNSIFWTETCFNPHGNVRYLSDPVSIVRQSLRFFEQMKELAVPGKEKEFNFPPSSQTLTADASY